MKVEKMIDLGRGHLIEIGRATWDETEVSVRNRYPTSTGGFSPRSSSEIPISDVVPIVKAVANEDLLGLKELMDTMESLINSANRQT